MMRLKLSEDEAWDLIILLDASGAIPDVRQRLLKGYKAARMREADDRVKQTSEAAA